MRKPSEQEERYRTELEEMDKALRFLESVKCLRFDIETLAAISPGLLTSIDNTISHLELSIEGIKTGIKPAPGWKSKGGGE